jgi:hypothetical protein
MEKDPRGLSPEDVRPASYEPPQVECVMDAEDLAREVHYAGISDTVSR